MAEDTVHDLLVIGGGVNGCGIARDAAGRGLSVVLAEMGDLASATSSASTKLFHGGLRYLEYFDFKLVRESLQEREVLLQMMPHISWPMRFVLPVHPEARFEGATPVSRLLSTVMPWLKDQRPAWLIRLGLRMYDRMGGRHLLPPTTEVPLDGPLGRVLRKGYSRAYEYSDGWVDDARLVTLNAVDAAARGADIRTRTRVTAARRDKDLWRVMLEDQQTGTVQEVRARALVNAAGPWGAQVLTQVLGRPAKESLRLVRGSHIVTRRLYDHDRCYFLQGADRRIVFVIPYEDDFTLIGTTDVDHLAPDIPAACSHDERDYLCDMATRALDREVTAQDVVWSYSGVRPLLQDGAESASAATRDYVLKLEEAPGAPLLTVFGGKITTYRRLSEEAVDKLAGPLELTARPWTRGAALPGGDFPMAGRDALTARLRRRYPFLGEAFARRLMRSYGTLALQMLGEARSIDDLGRDFGATLHEREVRWLMEHEFARTAEDVIWRRSKLGLRLTTSEVAALQGFMAGAQPATSPPAEGVA